MNGNALSLGAACALLLVGCGGGSSTPASEDMVLTGVFVDSPVEGATYATQTQSGTTNAAGEFSYLAGEQVTFSIGATQLPAVAAAAQVTPVDIAASSATPAAMTTNIARLLQSLDTDGNPENGIAVHQDAINTLFQLNFDVSVVEFEQNPDVINLVANSGSSITTLISADQANAHLAGTLNSSTGDGTTSSEQAITEFSQSNLINRYLVPILDNVAAGWTVYRFDQASVLNVADIGDDGDLRFGPFPWSVQSDGTFVADFRSTASPSECFYDVQSTSNEIMDVDVFCTRENSTFMGQYYLSKPLAASDLINKSWTTQAENSISFGENGNGTQLDMGVKRDFTYSTAETQAVDIRYLDTQGRSEFVLLQGTVDDGLFMLWDFNSDDRFVSMSFLRSNGTSIQELGTFSRD